MVGSAPCSRNRAWTVGSFAAATISALILSITARGVPAGASMEKMPEARYSGRPASAVVGTFGRAASRVFAGHWTLGPTIAHPILAELRTANMV